MLVAERRGSIPLFFVRDSRPERDTCSPGEAQTTWKSPGDILASERNEAGINRQPRAALCPGSLVTMTHGEGDFFKNHLDSTHSAYID